MNSTRSMRVVRKSFLIPGILLLAFIVSRLLYFWAGVRFHGDTFYLGWQFIDPLLLKTDLWRSLFYLHGQPPLLNAFTGIVLQLFPARYTVVFHTVYLFCGIVLLFSVFGLGIKLGFPRWVAVAISVWYILSPVTVIYENWYAYAYPLTTALCFAAYFLFRFVESGKPIDGILFSIPLAIMSLTWGFFHLSWLILCVGIGAFVLMKKKRVKSILWLLLAVALVTAWYGKNAIVFGSFTASSWGGMNLSKIVTLHIPGEIRAKWVKQGLISDLGRLPPFRSPDTYLRYFPDTPVTGIPLLDEIEYSTGFPNFHHLVFIEASDQQMQDAIRMIQLAPGRFVRTLMSAAYIFFHSASDYEHVAGIRAPIEGIDTVWNRSFYGQWQKGESFGELGSGSFLFDHVGWGLVIEYGFAFVASCVYLWKNRASIVSSPRFTLVLFMLWNILFVSVAGTILDIGENNRFRFVIDPFVFLLVVFSLKKFLESIKGPISQTRAG